jgi:hypothetical protein
MIRKLGFWTLLVVFFVGWTTVFASNAAHRQQPSLECVAFNTGYANGTILGSGFSAGGFDFISMGSDLFINEIAPGIIGLQFPDAGLAVKLAQPVSQVSLSLGSWGGPLKIEALDPGGSSVDFATVTAHNVIQSITLSGTDIIEVMITGGSNEGVLVSTCPNGGSSPCVAFEDQRVGAHYVVGDTFTDSGVEMLVDEFQWSSGTMTPNGFVEIQNGGQAGGTGNDLNVNNANVSFTLPASVEGLYLRFGEYGGNLNIRINGDFVNFEDFADINGKVIGGVDVSVFNGHGNDMGMLILNGSVTDFAIGGQELFIDDVCFISCKDNHTDR